MSMNGVDISHWQKGINIAKIPCDFVIMKATQGTSFVDPCLREFYKAAKSTGKKLGVYHYFAGGDPVKEAEHFLENVRDYIGEAILVLDWEQGSNSKFNDGAAVAKPFLDHVYHVTGVRPLIYMSKSVCRGYDWSSVVAGNYGLWMAQYKNYDRVPYLSKPWTDNKGMGAFKTVAIHQYTSSGLLPGYDGRLDLNVAYMTPQAWDKYAAAPNKRYYPQYTGDSGSIIDALQSVGADGSYKHRQKIAAANGIDGYTGTAKQNILMLALIKSGKLLKP